MIMKRHRPLILSASLLVMLAAGSCTDSQPEMGSAESSQTVFTAGFADAMTKTALQSNGAVFWDTEESIAVFSGLNSFMKYTSSNDAPSDAVSFTGDGAMKLGDRYFAVYPFDGASFGSHTQTLNKDETNMTTVTDCTLPVASVQTAVEGTFAKNTFPMVAFSENTDLAFRHLCGGVKFCVSQSGITSVELKGNNSETIAGTLKYVLTTTSAPADTVETVSIVSAQGSDRIILNAPEGGFVPQAWYYIVVPPVTFEKGFTLTFKFGKGKRYSDFVTDKQVTVHRAKFGVLSSKDAGLTINGGFTDITDYGVYSATDSDEPVPVYTFGDNAANQASFGTSSSGRFFRLVSLTTENRLEIRFSSKDVPVAGTVREASCIVSGKSFKASLKVVKVDNDSHTAWLTDPRDEGKTGYIITY